MSYRASYVMNRHRTTKSVLPTTIDHQQENTSKDQRSLKKLTKTVDYDQKIYLIRNIKTDTDGGDSQLNPKPTLKIRPFSCLRAKNSTPHQCEALTLDYYCNSAKPHLKSNQTIIQFATNNTITNQEYKQRLSSLISEAKVKRRKRKRKTFKYNNPTINVDDMDDEEFEEYQQNKITDEYIGKAKQEKSKRICLISKINQKIIRLYGENQLDLQNNEIKRYKTEKKIENGEIKKKKTDLSTTKKMEQKIYALKSRSVCRSFNDNSQNLVYGNHISKDFNKNNQYIFCQSQQKIFCVEADTNKRQKTGLMKRQVLNKSSIQKQRQLKNEESASRDTMVDGVVTSRIFYNGYLKGYGKRKKLLQQSK